jgi:tRNA-dihydrouridine synthase A
MMEWTDRHFRYFVRRMTRHTLLYTEMITTGALLRGDRARLLAHDESEHPLAVQLGGDDAGDLVACARLVASEGFDEVNLNVGCPSDRVQRGRFGACLMREPEVVAEAVTAMRAAVAIPVTVKHRLGVDDLDRYEDLLRFVDVVAAAGGRTFVVHARKAWLQGLSPKENREVPPLRYEDVYRLKRERPSLRIELNGGVRSLDEVEHHLERVDGVMLGRVAYEDPWVVADADRRIFGDRSAPPRDRLAVADELVAYSEARLAEGERLTAITRHLLGLFHGEPGARDWRRRLSEGARGAATVEPLREAVAALRRRATAAPPPFARHT